MITPQRQKRLGEIRKIPKVHPQNPESSWLSELRDVQHKEEPIKTDKNGTKGKNANPPQRKRNGRLGRRQQLR